MSKTKRILAGSVIALGITLLLITPHVASAGCGKLQFGCWLKAFFVWAVINLGLIVTSFGTFLLSITSLFVERVLAKNYILLDDPLVTEGFRFTISFANFGFVIAIILIAFATILRRENYGMKKMIVKLVLAAVLVNFSLLLGGLLLDFSHVLTTDLLSPFAAEGGVANGLANVFNPHNLNADLAQKNVQNVAYYTEKGGIMSATVLGFMIRSWFAAFMTFFLVFLTAAVGVMFMYRYVALAILLVLMPIAWMFWVIPTKSELARRWWDKFLEQVLYLPAAIFFLFLTVQSGKLFSEQLKNQQLASPYNLGAELTKLTKRLQDGEISQEAYNAGREALVRGASGFRRSGSILLDTPEAFADFFIAIALGGFFIVGLGMAALIVAQKTSTHGAQITGRMMRASRRYGVGALRRGGRLGYRGTKFAAQPITRPVGSTFRRLQTAVGGRVVKPAAGAVADAAYKKSDAKGAKGTAIGVGKAILRGTGLGLLASRAAVAGQRGKEASAKVVETRAAELKSKYATKEQREQIWKQTPADTTERATLVKIALEDGRGKEFEEHHGKERAQEYYKAARDTGIGDELIKKAPHRADVLASPELREKTTKSLADRKESTSEENINKELIKNAARSVRPKDVEENLSKEAIKDVSIHFTANQRLAIERSDNISEDTKQLVRTDFIEGSMKKLESAIKNIGDEFATESPEFKQQINDIKAVAASVKKSPALMGVYGDVVQKVDELKRAERPQNTPNESSDSDYDPNSGD